MSLVKWKAPPDVESLAQFGISAEPTPSDFNMQIINATMRPSSGLSFSATERTEFARAIATDLLRYLTSFGSSAGEEGMKLLDQWFLKFSRKMDNDPNFWKRVLLKE
mmetsp:Transcript_8712/g.15734  ORF Transcript_8712/g.15734 Transcript_8712/m.15734 type:complete len:107 (-) Transcript_8712:65-385(-)